MSEKALLSAAVRLALAVNKATDENLPESVANIVKLHSGIAVGTALVPVPGVNIVAGAGNIWTMYLRLNDEVGVPFSQNVIKSLAVGVLTNIGGAAIGVLLVGTALRFIPGIGSIGGAALTAGVSYAITLASGIVYMNALAKIVEMQNGGRSVSAEDLKAALDEELSQKDIIKDILKQARDSYKRDNPDGKS
ncbi:hypothetical protein [Brevundimonas sp. A19_0]|uniref:hypothetical protein n=1 Tax=Brevundimonas sp. A19_0 TaxID=2821087 RepID=UPI001ADA29E0|nr:hypothetical protein [Brevundimonas sp. A19_0]MBO9501277.1 hypothetical protein [Brevundimonas sp. A19_0]